MFRHVFGKEEKFSHYQSEKASTLETNVVSDISPAPLIRVADVLGLCTPQNETRKIDSETAVTTLQNKQNYSIKDEQINDTIGSPLQAVSLPSLKDTQITLPNFLLVILMYDPYPIK